MCSDPDMTRYYCIGGLILSLSGPVFAEREELSLFRCPPEPPCLRVEAKPVKLPELPTSPVLHRTLFTQYYGGGRVVCLEDGRPLFVEREEENRIQVQIPQYALQYYDSNIALRILNLPRRLLAHGGLFLHAACVEHNGGALILTAPSGGGKSTQAALWKKHRGAQIINGDRTLLRKLDGVWYAFGSPYCGTSGICLNRAAPVRAIVLLGKSADNRIRPAEPRQTLTALLGGITYDAWDRNQTEQVLSLAEELMRVVPVFRLDCRPDESAVKTLEDILWTIS